MNLTPTLSWLGALALGALALGACGTGGSGVRTAARGPSPTSAAGPGPSSAAVSSTDTPGPSGASTTTATMPTTAAPTTPSTTTTVAATTRSARCRADQLHASLGQAGAAAGHVGDTITLHNASATTCTLEGYPGLALLGSGGRPLPTEVHRGAGYIVRPETPTLVTLAPGQDASFALGYADATGYSGQACPTSQSVEVTPPNAFHFLVLAASLAPYGPCGAVTVSPLYPGTGPQPASG